MSADRPNWVEEFESKGYAVIEDFATAEECDEMKAEMYRVMNGLDITTEHKTVFSTGEDQQQLKDDYFLTSGDKIRYFFEKDALDEQGELKVEKDKSLNKVGHALHWHSDVFKRFSFSKKMKGVMKGFRLEDPAIIQSMYIFKNPRIGGAVCPHQDASFLWLDPLKLYGVWLAVDDATLDNGCLWFIPGSHQEGKLDGERRMLRVTKKVGDEERVTLKHVGISPTPDDALYTACPVKKGSLVLIHGMVMHKSESNLSEKPRNAYTLHVIEQKGTVWSSENWLQPTAELPFTAMNAN
ncbi:phytanoyl-CoA dioxygenase domain-containing protein 1-like [Watersipora subatra]|uniref:phytanoyl-CoA dioxygenase domain-containing protein 1-like n=1 Tax=Watersipora subatra TaxID=2589382 RepID=UPI00355C37E2